MIPDKIQLAEFKRLFHEANDVALSHDEFLKLVFNAAVQIGLGDYRKWAATEAERDRYNMIVYGREPKPRQTA